MHMIVKFDTPQVAGLFTGPSTPINREPDHHLTACYHTLFTDFITERGSAETEDRDEMIGGVLMLS